MKRKPLASLAGGVSARLRWQVSQQALSRWDSSLKAAAPATGERTISVLDVIGPDYWTGEGVTSKRIAAALRSMGAGPVDVVINSPGGDVFEGLAIRNLLREHQGPVTVKVIGLAASAASIIMTGGDNIQIAKSGFVMIHNCWTVAGGDQHQLRQVADYLEPFDAAMAEIYVERTGGDIAEVRKMMDAETWIVGSAAVDAGFADDFLDSDQISNDNARASASAVRQMECALRASGIPKSEACRLISQFKASAGDPAGSGEGDPAASADADLTAQLLAGLSSFQLN